MRNLAQTTFKTFCQNLDCKLQLKFDFLRIFDDFFKKMKKERSFYITKQQDQTKNIQFLKSMMQQMNS